LLVPQKTGRKKMQPHFPLGALWCIRLKWRPGGDVGRDCGSKTGLVRTCCLPGRVVAQSALSEFEAAKPAFHRATIGGNTDAAPAFRVHF